MATNDSRFWDISYSAFPMNSFSSLFEQIASPRSSGSEPGDFNYSVTQDYLLPITVTVWPKAGTVVSFANTGIMSSNPTLGTDMCRQFFLSIQLCVGSSLAAELIISLRSRDNCLQAN